MSFYQISIGDQFEAKCDLNEVASPLPSVLPGYPTVTLKEGTAIIGTTVGNQTATPGDYTASLTIPKAFDLQGRDHKTLTLVWVFYDGTSKYNVSQIVQVIPDLDHVSIHDDVLLLTTESEITVHFDHVLQPGDTCIGTMHLGNEAMTPMEGTFESLGESTRVVFDTSDIDGSDPDDDKWIPRLIAYTLIITGSRTVGGTARNYHEIHRVYYITPQIANAMQQVSALLQKSRIANIIPSLQYSNADILMYLERGLGSFNGFPPTQTYFDGTNMEGPILSGWIACTMIWAIGAQLLAESDLNFDFSGQSVQLNVDRTPALDAAISRWEGVLEREVRPLKLNLARNGNTQGDGSIGGPSNGSAMGGVNVGNHNMLNTRFNNSGNRRIQRGYRFRN